MRFACQNCQAKYSIPDERVQNRVIRLRCQKCGTEITIRGPSATPVGSAPKPFEPEVSFPNGAPDEPGRESTKIASLADLEQIRRAAAQESARPKAKAEPASIAGKRPEQAWLGADWHVIVKGEQVGPLSVDDIRAKVAAAELTARTYAWREDMADWQRLAAIAIFAELFASVQAPTYVPPTGPPPRRKSEPQKIGALVDPEVKATPSSGTPWNEAGAPLATRKETPLSEVADLFGPPSDEGAKPLPIEPTAIGGVARAGGFPSDPGPSGSAFGDAPNEPRESTRVFVAAAGFVSRRKHQRLAALAAGAVVVALLTVIGLDVSGVIEIPALGAAYRVLGVENPHAADLQSQFSTNLTDAERARLKQGLMGGKKKEAPKPAGNIASKPAPDLGKADDIQIGAPTSAGSGAIAAANPEGEQKMLNDLFQDGSKVEMKVAAPKLKTPEADAAQGLSAEQITHVVEGNQKAVKFCFERAMKKGQQLNGKMEVEFTIAPSGVVSVVEVKTAKYKATEFGDCTAQAIKSWKFPRFSGDPVAVEYPFILSAAL